ncbi:(2Fe-2S)-binding protein [Halanaerobium hydrogeniformans]|uniref:(2Fe-2S)-binding domain-containing protein n=1 Tax=Halanaerobium hydrogeniformans TaxID=656519 RepID=E4RJV3_HALHG|nr:(2Fe-2S)-binding protein [Halanaerobium hydrogeniformans]ADQ15523.1 (2Fe-2S)-binding domain-containing protein [Halanaerobium hydrogeniformans]
MAKLDVEITVNSKKYNLKVGSQERLLDTIRKQLKLTGTKEGCSVGECGACTVIIDDKAVNSCMVLTAQADGSEIITVEGLESKKGLSPLQKAFVDKQAIQCGFCTPGMLMSALALLKKNPRPSKSEIKTALEGNLCRCTGYQQIIEAVETAAKEWGV